MEENLESYKKAGKILAESLEFARSLVKEGSSLLEVTERIERKIKEKAELAFPVQISLNDIAAHYCARFNDNIIFNKDVIKIDIGVHVNGFIADAAITIDLSESYKDLVKASEEALKEALKLALPETELWQIGKTIQEVIQSYGYMPITNLSGHGIEKGNVHCKPTVPNINNNDKNKLKEGQVIAIEPFATTGSGYVYESSNAEVFSLLKEKPVRGIFTKQILNEIRNFEKFPFAKRWLANKYSLGKVNFAFKELLEKEIIKDYPPLIERQHGIVSQAEHTVIVADKPIVITKSG